ncbi:HNH endonuclease [Corynebacterium sp. NPDC060344]|uniref:HNH endonuclease n=1 Tax=Corynebacterium sp. NPDC060344 TaxID=3347101 RepID=UPI00365EB921
MVYVAGCGRCWWVKCVVVVSLVLVGVFVAELLMGSGVASAQDRDRDRGEGGGVFGVSSGGDARAFAVDVLDSGLPASSAAAAVALGGSVEEFEAYRDSGLEVARNQDLRWMLVTISSIGGPRVQARVSEILSGDGGPDSALMVGFVESEWEVLQAEDDRAVAWEAARAPEGSSVKAAADQALRDNSAESLGEFAASGVVVARGADARREVYELTRSELPSVAAGASEAIQVNSDEAIDGFLRYGQFVAAAQDAELMSTAELVEMSIREAEKASEANSLAVQQADRAARAADNARRATVQAAEEAQAADGAQVRAGNAASAAGQLAEQSGRVADQAVVAAQEARVALQQTADALARAASAAARARAAASTAAARASDASRDASAAAGARVAAERARDAAQSARRSQQAYRHAATAATRAGEAGAAASSAAGNADAAAAAAAQAAGAAGVGESAAAEARAGAARARAAAGEVDRLVKQIEGLVDQARRAAEEAAEHARRSAEAAEEAARQAGNAEYAARMSGEHAADAQRAAAAAGEAMELARVGNEISVAIADDRLESERAFLRGEAEDARAVEDALGAAAVQRQRDSERLLADVDALREPGQRDVDSLRRTAVAAVQVGGPAVAGAAKTALLAGDDAALRVFGDEGFADAAYADDLAVAQHWAATDPDPAVREAALAMVYEDDRALREFVTSGADGLMVPGLKSAAWQLRDSAGDNTRAAADQALVAGTFEALDGFVNGGGYGKARWSDQIQQAYHLADTGGPEVKAAAEAAVVGDRAGLERFIAVEQYRRAMMDGRRDAHAGQIASMLEMGRHAADVAAEQAANARVAHEHALGSAQRAGEYARVAAEYAGSARESSRMAGEHVSSAQQSLSFATAQQARAHEAAAAAGADARQATANADRAMSFAADARASASVAASSAASARASAVAAGQDAAVASQAASDAYTAAWQLEMSEQSQLHQALGAEGQDDPAARPVSLLDTLREVVGPAALALILDVLGITDIQNCFKGQLSGCLWTAVGLLPVGKLAKVAKAMPALRKLLGKAGEVRAALSGRGKRVSDALARVTTPPGCRVVGAAHGGDVVFEFPRQFEVPGGDDGSRQFVIIPVADICGIPDTVAKVNGRYPINAKYAGANWKFGNEGQIPDHILETYGNIAFTEKGFPIFTPHVWKIKKGGKMIPADVVVELGHSPRVDIKNADKIMGIDLEYRQKHKLTWHHHEDTGRMQMIPTELHREVKHTGGASIWGAGWHKK